MPARQSHECFRTICCLAVLLVSPLVRTQTGPCPPGVQCEKLRVGELRTLLTLSEVLFNCLCLSWIDFCKSKKKILGP